MEDALISVGFFDFKHPLDKDVKRFKLFESYKGTFLRIIVAKRDDDFVVEHIYFDSDNSLALQTELFGKDISVEGVIKSLKRYRDSSKEFDNDIPETG